MGWIPIVLVIFKVIVLGTSMFVAVKWHYDQGKKEKDRAMEMRAVLRASGKVVVVFALSLLGLALLTYVLVHMVGLNLASP